MDQSLEEQYITWLYRQVASVRFKTPARTYWSLIRQLHQKEFVWFIPNDDNRVEDGRDLRYEFCEENEIVADASWIRSGCTMLEMLIALSRRLSFEADGESSGWFWELMENLDLHEYTDLYYRDCDDTLIDNILARVIDRTYEPDGHGGLFPLNELNADQRKVELWNQCSLYLLERE